MYRLKSLKNITLLALIAILTGSNTSFAAYATVSVFLHENAKQDSAHSNTKAPVQDYSSYAKEAVVPKSKNGLVVIAHRGNHKEKAQNSLASIEDAIRVGADYVEIDVRTSKDGFLLLHHDETIAIPDFGKVKVSDLSWGELTKIPLKGKDGLSYPVAGLKEALALSKGRINIYLDFKDADALQVFEEVRDVQMEDNVLVYINDLKDYEQWRKVAPHIPLISELPEEVKTKADIVAFKKTKNWQVLDGVQDNNTIALLAEQGIPVFLDAQGKDEGEEKWFRILDKGVNGIQTDKPEELIEFLKKHNLRNGEKALPIRKKN